MAEPADRPAPVSPAEYIDAIAQHVSSVCIITTAFEGERFGLTATAVSSVSAEPPRLLVCVNKSGFTHDKIVQAGHFCVNVLTEDQDRIAMVFAGMGGADVDRFATGDWTRLTTGSPVLAQAAAVFDCVIASTSEQSTHTVLFGEVVATRHARGRDTLLYGARRFRQLRKVFEAGGGEYGDYL
ncbi:MAG: flavin reductase family protein [Burkholderiaceae bacterium]|nr:flavin reductase family protein [Burkholderiaceae bacterium]